jgi:hypothetical protein
VGWRGFISWGAKSRTSDPAGAEHDRSASKLGGQERKTRSNPEIKQAVRDWVDHVLVPVMLQQFLASFAKVRDNDEDQVSTVPSEIPASEEMK